MNNTASGFAIYDGHGKRVATLTKSGSSFSLTDLRSYDAWGNVLGQNPTGRPRGRYVANLGHVQDDESGLVYMRARYYEPGSGRFVSEDPERDGLNWYSYCESDPVNKVDRAGKESIEQAYWISFTAAFFTAVGAIFGSSFTGRLNASSLMVAAFGFYLRFFVGLAEANSAKTLTAIAEEEFKNKLWMKGASGMFLGTALGAIAAYHLGDHAGKVAFELFYIDFWEEMPC